MPHGTVKFFNAAKGFGFITCDEGGKDFFMPGASLAAAGLAGVKPGQRVSFEAQPDGKGPKAVNIALLADAPPPKPVAAHPAPPDAAKPLLSFYHDPANAASCAALGRLRAAGHDPLVVDYLAAPPAIDELKSLSLLLRSRDQSLVRKYDPLFLELCLDDRFISENEFWGAIVEHPRLINGPVVATQTKASVCPSDAAIDAFLAALSSGWTQPSAPRKALPDRILQMVTGTAPSAVKPEPAAIAEPKPDRTAPKATILPATAKIFAAPKLKTNPAKAPAPKSAAKPKAPAKPKPVAKAKPAAKSKPKPKPAAKAKAKPAKKSRRA